MFRFFFLLLPFFVQKGKTRANSHTILHFSFSNIYNIININSIVLTAYLIHIVNSTQCFSFLLFLPSKSLSWRFSVSLLLLLLVFCFCSIMKTIFHRKRINHMENLISALTLKMCTIQTRARARAYYWNWFTVFVASLTYVNFCNNKKKLNENISAESI